MFMYLLLFSNCVFRTCLIQDMISCSSDEFTCFEKALRGVVSEPRYLTISSPCIIVVKVAKKYLCWKKNKTEG